MPLQLLRKYFLVFLVLVFQATTSFGQPCTGLGQTPSTAFPVCGTTVFHQASVPICATINIFVPGCSTQPGGASYQNKNPYFYKFTCYASGTLGFLITPLSANEDYDWQLWDITGQNPDAIFTNNSLVVAGNCMVQPVHQQQVSIPYNAAQTQPLIFPRSLRCRILLLVMNTY